MSQTLLYVNNTDPEDGGGGDRRLFEEAATLQENGADVRVVASRTDPEFAQKRVSNGVQIRTVKCVPDFLQRVPTVHFYLARSLFPFVSLPILLATLFHVDIDVVVDNHTPHPSLVAFLGPLLSVPVVALVHEYHDRSAIEKYPLPVGIIQLVVQNFLRIELYAAVIVPREETKEALLRYGTSVPIHVVPNGLDVSAYLEPPATVETEAFDFVVVSRLVHRKGIDRLLEAMALVAAEDPSAQLGIAGSGPERNRLERQAAELGISENVAFLGFVSEERKRALLHESSVFVLPSRQEGFGIAVLEAMATGTSVVANDLDIIRRLLPEGPNKLVDAGDAEAFAAAMMDVLNEERDGEQTTTPENQEEAEQYSLDRVGEQATSVYDQVRAHT
ncbi:glycosyltransferase family 1 protein [Halobellus sp. Atlit-38R]|uniref:glycosyltransferase family 4 protein n=1 Tax=Halobellus sp. Atlit-38R TaxID=2282131 RepID=UPI000EF1C835|nr:glycosyltransferase family 4 protein [Halobellus sp. Atlit-38R]RLM83752.1 glycosyltransferase family 1 protein [Halobellus sp. Atlit-38R]